jgi:hypothetical protein
MLNSGSSSPLRDSGAGPSAPQDTSCLRRSTNHCRAAPIPSPRADEELLEVGAAFTKMNPAYRGSANIVGRLEQTEQPSARISIETIEEAIRCWPVH